MHPMLTIAVKAARKAGSIINRSAFDLDKLNVRQKRPKDFVSEVDHAAEEAIIAILRQAYPKHAFLGEEGGAQGEHEYTWIIDPLDGTTNYLHGFPQYCVSIALRYRTSITQAVVFDPVRNDLFYASKGGGAYLNERRIRVSATKNMDEALIGTGFPFRMAEDIDPYIKQLRAVMLNTAGVRRPGAAALDLAYVACGRLDGFWEMGLSPWDMAAGALLVREAGGIAADFEGGDSYLDAGKIIVGNPKVFPQLYELVSGKKLRL